MLTILHTADLHMDRAFGGLGMRSARAAERRQELREAFRRFVDLALELRADAVTIGGDLYEHDRFTLDTAHFIRGELERLGPIPVFIAPGNHDPYLPGSLYRQIEWPPNVTIFSEPRFRPVPLADGVTLWGAGHDGPALRQDILQGFRVSGPGLHILLFHGSDMAAVPEGKVTHCPFRPEEVAASGASFALLGHYHQARLSPPGRPLFAYPGSPEPLGFDEEGQHYVLRLTLDGGAPQPDLIPFSQVVYRTHRLDISAMLSSEEIRRAIEALAAPGEGEDAPTDPVIARVILEGQLQPEVDLDLKGLLDACAHRFRYLDLADQTYPAYDLDELAEQGTTKGAFVRLLGQRMEALSGEELEIARAALLYGLHAFDNRELRLP